MMENNSLEINNLTDCVMNKVRLVQVKRDQQQDQSQPSEIHSTKCSYLRQYFMVVLANVGVVSTGMGLGFPAVSLTQLTDSTQDFFLNSEQASWFASINAMSCPLGGVISGYLLDHFGRKITIIAFNLMSLISWALLFVSFTNDNNLTYIQIMTSRFLIGIATGLASSPVGVYSAEICHPSLRGRLTLGTSIATAFGIMLIYILGYFVKDDYQLISKFVSGYAALSLLLCLRIPESPVWLLANKKEDEALKNLKFFRGIDKSIDSDESCLISEWEMLQKNLIDCQGQRKPTLLEAVKQRQTYMPLLIMIGFFACQQFSGIFVVIVYAVQFSIEAGVTIDPLLCAIFIGFTRTATTFFVGMILDKWGRRPPAITSACGMAICMFMLAAATWFPNSIGRIPYITIACIIIYIFTSTLGLMTLPFSMIAEVFPPNVRGLCSGMTICCGYLMSFVTIKLYPGMVSSIGNHNVFALYGLVSVLSILYVYYFLPETKGKSLQEIENYFKKRADSDQKITEYELKRAFLNKS